MPTHSGTTMTAKKRLETVEKKSKELEATVLGLEEAITFSKNMDPEDYMDPEFLDNEQEKEQPEKVDTMEQKKGSSSKDFFITLGVTKDGTTRKASTLERLRKLEEFVENLDRKFDEIFEYLFNAQPEYMEIPEEVWDA